MHKNAVKNPLFVVGLMTIASTAHAQSQSTQAPQSTSTPTTNAADIADIVVTAQRRSEVVTNVPISISVANQAQLERQQVNTVTDLSRIAPSLEMQSAQGQNTGGGGTIRGIGTLTFSAGAVASVGIVVDQVSQGNANLSDLFDVSRIEVLKGPQGTLFGLTTSAGVINITTNAPDPSALSGRVRTELSDAGTAGSRFGQQVFQGVLNVPVSADAALRLSGSVNLRQGPGHNVIDDEYTQNNRYSARGRFLWEPTDRLTINLIGDYAEGRETDEGDFFQEISANADITSLLASCGITVGEGNQDFCSTKDMHGKTRNYGGSLQVDYDGGPLILTSVTSYRRDTSYRNQYDVLRLDPSPTQIFSPDPMRTKVELITQEFRAASPSGNRVEFTIGAFYSRQHTIQDPNRFLVTVTVAPGVSVPVSADAGARNDIVDESLAAFGQATFHVTDQFSLIAGGRLTSQRLGLDRLDFNSGATTPTRSRLALSTTNFSYRLGAQYNFTRDTILYATISRGYKGGQIATRSFPNQPYIVKPEIPQNYELGFKTTLFDGVVADLSAFYTRFADFQAQSCKVDASTNFLLQCLPNNVSAVVTKGAEINLFGRVFDGFNVNTGLIYAQARYPKGYLGKGDGSDIGGTQLAFAPEWKFTFSGEYAHALTSNFNGFLGVDTIWKSRIRYEENNNRASTFRPHWIVGGRIGVRDADNRFEAAIFVRNLFNVHEPLLLQSEFPVPGAENVAAIYGPGAFRQVGLSLSARF